MTGTVAGTDATVDGLRTFAYPADSPRAVILVRTPYDARSHHAESVNWAARGFTTVVQDVRGRYGSEGTFRPYHCEGTDGVNTLDWITAQPWWTDSLKIVLYGASYGAHCAVETAVEATRSGYDHLGGVSVVVPALGMGETARNRDGSFYLESRYGWWAQHGDARVSRRYSCEGGVLETLPVSGIGARTEPSISSWDSVLSADRSDEERSNTVAALNLPLLVQGGTMDWFAQDSVDLWSSWGGPSALALGPWDHGMRGSRRAERMNSWLNDVLDGRPWTGARAYGNPAGPVDLESWPTARRTAILPGGFFLADPKRPFPSREPGSNVQDLLSRPDCLVLPVRWHPGIVVGTPIVRIETDDRDRQWGALLLVCGRDGRAVQLAHGMSLGALIHLSPVSTYIDQGEELFVIVSAHSFPRHARDLHSGEDHLYGARMVTALRSVIGVELAMPV